MRFYLSGYNTITENIVIDNQNNGIYLEEGCDHNDINNNDFNGNNYGIELYYSDFNSITDNNVVNNSYSGIEIEVGSFNTFIGNIIANNTSFGIYVELDSHTLTTPAEPRPFVGLPASAPKRVVSFLQEQGYILDVGGAAATCGTYLEETTLAGVASDVELVDIIEASPGPLVKFGRWPDGAKSALSVTGDLDALTLLDYASRLFAR